MSLKPAKISMREQEQLTLRADLKDAKTMDALKALGLEVPDARKMATKGQQSARKAAMWFSPDELLIFVPDAQKAVKKIKGKLPAKHLVHDASGARVVINMEGTHLRDILSKGTPRDVMNVEIGEVVRTHLGQFAVAFWFLDESHAELVCFRSFAQDLVAWLKTAAQPDGLPVLQN